MTLEDVGKIFGLVGVRSASCSSGSKGIKDARNHFCGGAKSSADPTFCRTAAISEDIVIYDLGPRSYRLQLEAVVKRSLTDELVSNGEMTLDQLLEYVPQHTKCLCACVECKRVSNAVATDGGSKWNVSFNEIGTSGSMISTDALSNESHLRYAKRCSTSLKTAIANEEEMNVCDVESMDVKEDTLRSMLHCGGEIRKWHFRACTQRLQERFRATRVVRAVWWRKDAGNTDYRQSNTPLGSVVRPVLILWVLHQCATRQQIRVGVVLLAV